LKQQNPRIRGGSRDSADASFLELSTPDQIPEYLISTFLQIGHLTMTSPVSPAPVGYTFRAENETPANLLYTLVLRGYRAPGALGMSAEAVLDQWAAEKGIDRQDENSFDSDTFPKIITSDQLTDDDAEWVGF
jgi:hypothetical protein